MAATVRIKVEDAQGYSFGTGTIIDVHGPEMLIVTCGHIFRESRGKGRITVDLFASGVARSVPGELVLFDASDSDIGLVSIRPGVEIAPIRVAPSGQSIAQGQRVFSIGCNNGRPPTLKRSQITSVDRYVGPPNVQVAGMPVNGRSGGGLFTEDGMLIGICNAADQQDDEGIYAALGVVHQTLAQIGQQRLFEAAPAATLASMQSVSPEPGPPVRSTPPVTANHDLEIICIFRSRSNPGSPAKTIVLDAPSDELLRRLKEESSGNQSAAAVQSAGIGIRDDVADARSAAGWPKDSGQASPIVRGQSREER